MKRYRLRRAGKYVEVPEVEYHAARAPGLSTFNSQPSTSPKGLGDAVALVAEPIARLSDAVLGTKLVGCGGCAQRRAALNALVPDITKPLP